MDLTKDEVDKLKAEMANSYSSINAGPGEIVTITCSDRIVWKNKTTGVEFLGCGKTLTKFIFTGDSDSTWDMVSDMYLAHLHNVHDYEIDISPFDITD